MTASEGPRLEALGDLRRRLAAAVAAGASGPDPVTVVVVPSLSVDRDLLRAVPDMQFFEHRMLYLLRLLRRPDVRVVVVTSRPVSPRAVDYLLDLTPAMPASARERLTLLTCPGATDEPLALRVLGRPDLLGRIRAEVDRTDLAYLECYASTESEQALALALDVPVLGPEPALSSLGRKSRGRALLREVGVPTLPGIEDIHGTAELSAALAQLAAQEPGLGAAVVKLEDSVGGLGNAVFRFADAGDGEMTPDAVSRALPSRLELGLPVIDVGRFLERVDTEGCMVERLVEGPGVRSPSAQGQIAPDGTVTVVAAHDQLLSGTVDQHFSGCLFPAADPGPLHAAAHAVGLRLAVEGVVGWYGVDFLDVRGVTGREVHALEINVRSLGTVHHVMTLTGLLGGAYDLDSGLFLTDDGRSRAYYGTDGVKLAGLVGVDAARLVAACEGRPWAYEALTGTGVVLHMLDAAQQHGRVGMTCIADTPAGARALFVEAVRGLEAIASGLTGDSQP